MNVSQKTLLSYLEERAALTPDRKTLGRPGRWLDAAKTMAIVEHVGATFRRMGMKPGMRIAIGTQRCVGASIVMLGLRAVGAICILCDPRQSITDILASTEEPITVDAMIEQTGETVFLMTWLTEQNIHSPETVSIDLWSLSPSAGSFESTSSTDPAFVIFTSGSTGNSKAVVLSESNLINNLLDSQSLGDYREDDLALGALPLHHVFGLVLLAGVFVLGYGLYFPEKTEIPCLLEAIEKEGLTRMNGVPSLYLAMAAESHNYNLTSMRVGYIGGGPITKEQFEFVENTLGMTLIPVYGMSECIGISCASFRDSMEERANGVGRIYAMNTGKIVREDGTKADILETGEICVNGPARMLGYWGQPMDQDAFLHTGDLGYLDEQGILHLSGRKKDIIIRNGNNLSPRKIEQAILSVPDVLDAVVVGIADHMQGEVPAAMIVARDGMTSITVSLPKNEIPVLYHFVHALPMTSSGKPDRKRIREVLLQCRKA